MDYGLRMMLGGGMFFWLIPLSLLIIIIISAFKVFGPTKSSDVEDPLNKLKLRYAKGEIDEEQYIKMRERLRE